MIFDARCLDRGTWLELVRVLPELTLIREASFPIGAVLPKYHNLPVEKAADELIQQWGYSQQRTVGVTGEYRIFYDFGWLDSLSSSGGNTSSVISKMLPTESTARNNHFVLRVHEC